MWNFGAEIYVKFSTRGHRSAHLHEFMGDIDLIHDFKCNFDTHSLILAMILLWFINCIDHIWLLPFYGEQLSKFFAKFSKIEQNYSSNVLILRNTLEFLMIFRKIWTKFRMDIQIPEQKGNIIGGMQCVPQC